MFAQWLRSIVAPFFVPIVAICLAASPGCVEEEGLEVEDENGVEVEEEGLGD